MDRVEKTKCKKIKIKIRSWLCLNDKCAAKLYFSIGRMMVLTSFPSPTFLIRHFNEIPALRLCW